MVGAKSNRHRALASFIIKRAAWMQVLVGTKEMIGQFGLNIFAVVNGSG